jgi:homoserine/homoserine lactone efflux protein
MPLELYLAYLVACFVVVIVPGPTATLIIANSLAHGTRAGLLNVAGTQLGLAAMIGLVGIGLASVIEAMGWWFDWLRLAGAAYLVWLGWQMLRAADRSDAASRAPSPRGGFFLQGCLVALSNPKTLVFFGAFFPQFVDPRVDVGPQIALLGVTAMVFAALADSSWAALSGGAGKVLNRARLRWLTRISGGVLIGGGVWLAFSRSR